LGGAFFVVAALDLSSATSSSSDNLRSSSSFSDFSMVAGCFFDDPGPFPLRPVVAFFFESFSSIIFSFSAS